MRTLFCASEVGSARALIPICHEAIRRGADILIDHHGYMTEIDDVDLSPFFTDVPDSTSEIQQHLRSNAINTLVFSVNIHDAHPLRVARVASTMGIRTIHVLDYWNGYRSRLELDGEPLFEPTMYLVPDEYARGCAIKEGIDDEIINVSGQPAFADLVTNNLPVDDLIPEYEERLLLFVSEPVAADQGSSIDENPAFRGYTERDVLDLLLGILKTRDDDLKLCILPHPRQDPDQLMQMWSSLGGDDYGFIHQHREGPDILDHVVAVTGMASTLLYEAWLYGKPVASIQPSLRNDSLRMLQSKEGICFVDDANTAEIQINGWLNSLADYRITEPGAELELHRRAPALICDIMMNTPDQERN